MLDVRYLIPDALYLPLIHSILAVAAAEHTETYTRDVEHVVGGTITRIYKRDTK